MAEEQNSVFLSKVPRHDFLEESVMIEFKFRAWSKTYQKMVFFDFDGTNIVCGDIYDGLGLCDESFDKGYSYLDDDFHVMQFSGLTDADGVEIYEGDILLIPNEHYRQGRAIDYRGSEDGIEIVIWEEATAAFAVADFTRAKELGVDWRKIDPVYLWVSSQEYGKIIGNIFENPELLRRK